jgi:hypothetical protein
MLISISVPLYLVGTQLPVLQSSSVPLDVQKIPRPVNCWLSFRFYLRAQRPVISIYSIYFCDVDPGIDVSAVCLHLHTHPSLFD